MCGTRTDYRFITESCAIALAIKEIFPEGMATVGYIRPYFSAPDSACIFLPESANQFMRTFDKLWETPEARLSLSELTFEVDVPQEIIDSIGLSQVRSILSSSATLKMVEEQS